MIRKIPIKDQTKVGVAKDANPLWWRPFLSWQEYINTAFCHFMSAFTPSFVWDVDETAFHMMEKQMNRLCSDFYNAYSFSGWILGGVKFEPDVDIVEHEEGFLIHADLPGVKPDDLDLSLTYDSLHISGCRCDEGEGAQKGGEVLHRERYCRAFDRTIALPEEVDAGKAEAIFDKSVLTVSLPKIYAGMSGDAALLQDNSKAVRGRKATAGKGLKKPTSKAERKEVA